MLYKAHKSFMKFYFILVLALLVGCGEDKKGSDGYKKQSDIPATGQSIDKKSSPGKKVSDYY
tara:strand:- start:374 stop:559 length:186 start_codon:yes stop_codon:yes gene_type:complete